MRLLEYQGKQVLEKYGIPVCTGKVAWTVDEAEKAANEIGYPVVIKAQVLAGGRGKAGGVQFGGNDTEVRDKAKAILGMIIKDEVTECILITEKSDIAQEMYAGITIDSIAGLPVLIFSCSGGMDIEQVAEKSPEKVLRKYLDPTKKITLSNIMDFLRKSELEKKLLPEVSKIVLKLVESFFGADATTAEINPLALLTNGKVVALDAKFVIDDSALKRQTWVEVKEEEKTELEKRAKNAGVNYVSLDGTIAVIAGGAGLAMATMDLVSYFKAKPASFVDTGGGINSKNMAEALRISLSKPEVEGVVINVFGGINDCKIMAEGIAEVIDHDSPRAKIVVKMRGHSQEEGWEILEKRNIPVIKFGTSEEAIQMLLNLL